MSWVAHLKTKPTRQWPCADSERVYHMVAKWSFVLVCPNSLIRHKSKYSIIFPYLRCNVSEWETIIYYANNRLVLQSCSNVDTEVGVLMFGSLYFILIKYHQYCQVSNPGTDVCVCVCVCARPLQLFPYTSRINFKQLLSYNASLLRAKICWKQKQKQIGWCFLPFELPFWEQIKCVTKMNWKKKNVLLMSLFTNTV